MVEMKKGKRVLSFVMAMLLLVGSLTFGETKAQAAMVDEAIDFQIGDTLQGNCIDGLNYYCFTLNSRQRIIMEGISAPKELRSDYMSWTSGEYSDGIYFYDSTGNMFAEIGGYDNGFWTYNRTTDLYSFHAVLTLNPGTYYIGIKRAYMESEYAFTTEYAPSTKYPSMQLSLNLKTGDTLQLGAMISPDAAKSKLKWSSSDKNIVGVSGKGKIKAKKQGTATITASCNGSKIKIQVIVK